MTDDRNLAADARRIVTERSHSWLSLEHGAALLAVIDAQSAAIAELQQALQPAPLGPPRITTPERLEHDLRASLGLSAEDADSLAEAMLESRAQADGDDGAGFDDTGTAVCGRCGTIFATNCQCDNERDR